MTKLPKNPGARGRKPVPRDLPPLSVSASEFRGWKKNDNRTDVMYEILKAVAAGHQQLKARPFYATREVAEYFGVANGTAAAVYKRMTREGLLIQERSSKTVIPPKLARPQHEIRGLVSVPIWLGGFMMHKDWRRWLMALDEELAHYRYAAEPVFFYSYDKGVSFRSLQERIMARNPDWVIWGFPLPPARDTMLRIADRGTQIMCLENQHTGFPGFIYRIDWQPALDKALREWKADRSLHGILLPENHAPTAIIPNLDAALATAGCKAKKHVLRVTGQRLISFLKRLLAQPRSGVIFNDDFLYARACLEEPKLMLKLFARHRVMVMREVMLPCEKLPPGVMGDTLQIPVHALARFMACDLANRKTFAGQPHLVAPEWRPRRPLAELVESTWIMSDK